MAFKTINKKLNKIIEEVDYHNHIARKKLSQKYSNLYQKELWVIGLYYSLIDHLRTITIILNYSKGMSGIYALFRSCLDSYINIKNIILDYDKFKKYEKNKLNELTKLMKKIDLNGLDKYQLIEITQCMEHHFQLHDYLKGIPEKYLTEKKKRTGIAISELYSALYDICSENMHLGHNFIKQSHILEKNRLYYATQTPKPDKSVILWSLCVLLGVVMESIIMVNFEIIDNHDNHNLMKIHKEVHSCIALMHSRLLKYGYPF